MECHMKITAVIQARMGSTRFPNKVMRAISGTPLIGLMLERLAKAKCVEQIVLATSTAPINEPLATYVRELGYIVYCGSENDVLDRYYQAAREVKADIVVRVTGDCPLIDPVIVDAVITRFVDSKVDYASNNYPPSFPDGLDVEVFTFKSLEKAWKEAKTPREREHVTPFIRESSLFKRVNVVHEQDKSAARWTVDEPEDFEVVQNVFIHFNPRRDFGWHEVDALQVSHPEWFAANRHFMRNDGAKISIGQKLWKRAKRVIPGGSMLLSKRPEMFLPEQWPAYFSRASGCRVWDLDDREFIDMSLMGIGTNTLGYGHPEVDEAVRRVITDGNMSTFNSPEEVYLAEKLIELHPWADMARFARSGGEANAVCIRIARAAAGRDIVAFCGYHGWHDWYLAANLGDEKNLAGHLLPGLQPNGVTRNLKGSVLPFTYNRFDELEKLVSEHDVGVIMMEVRRNLEPEDDFLQRVREFATAKGIVLVFDECTSGFRQSFGGLHKVYGVEPDMATFGKALGNGYAITAVIGRREVMTHADSTFISSTFWTERIGSVAALKTLEVMERARSWEKITNIGQRIGERWTELARTHSLPLRVSGLPAMIAFNINSPRMLAYKTLITQEMLKQGFLASTSVYTCLAHTSEIVDQYFAALAPIFEKIQECEDGRAIEPLLEGPVAHSGFRRLN